MNRHVKFLIKTLVMISMVVAPFLTLFIVTEKISNQYEKTYLAEFKDKYERLNSIDEPKIVFVGGSSLPFGLRSDLIEESVPSYKVVNYGLYATLGTKFMLDTSRSNINKGDVVIISPELNEQTYSLYFNPKAILQACDGMSPCYNYLTIKERLKLFYAYFDYSRDKLNYYYSNTTPDPVGIYRHDSFNEYGDIIINRPYNIMNNGYDSTLMISTNSDFLEKSFVDYINDYCDYVNGKGAKVFFNFSPCNEKAIQTSRKNRDFFEQKINDSMKCELLSNYEDCILDYRYFYDTNFHLNSSGAVYYTNLMIRNLLLKLKLCEEEEIDMDMDVPFPQESEEEQESSPEIKTDVDFSEYTGEGNIDYVDVFNYRLVGSTYQVTGVKKEFLDIENVIMPSVYEGKNISTISENTFYGCVNLKNIYIGKTYKSFEKCSFNGCISLKGIYLYTMDGNTLNPSSSGLLDGANKKVKIYVPYGSNYDTGYVWTNYSPYLSFFEVPE